MVEVREAWKKPYPVNDASFCGRVLDGAYMALIVEMTLPTSAYATMALREATKMDMSPQFQTTLNDAGTSRAHQQPEAKRLRTEVDAWGRRFLPRLKKCVAPFRLNTHEHQSVHRPPSFLFCCSSRIPAMSGMVLCVTPQWWSELIESCPIHFRSTQYTNMTLLISLLASIDRSGSRIRSISLTITSDKEFALQLLKYDSEWLELHD